MCQAFFLSTVLATFCVTWSQRNARVLCLQLAAVWQHNQMTPCMSAQEPYRDHYHEAGFNALFFAHAAHSWARNLRIVNADYGIGLMHAHFCTVEDVELTTDFRRDTMSQGEWSTSYRYQTCCHDSRILYRRGSLDAAKQKQSHIGQVSAENRLQGQRLCWQEDDIVSLTRRRSPHV